MPARSIHEFADKQGSRRRVIHSPARMSSKQVVSYSQPKEPDVMPKTISLADLIEKTEISLYFNPSV